MTSVPANSAILNVSVPTEAKVFVNGLPTTSTGAARRYVSNGLEPGFNYTYELRAEMVRDGKTVTESKSIKLKAGESAELSFDFSGSNTENVATEPVRTKLTLHVPADAKVFLSGNATQSAGDTREFTTTKLAKGAEWSDYVVRVEYQKDGRLMSEEKTLTLKGGENQDLNVDFGVAQVASSR